MTIGRWTLLLFLSINLVTASVDAVYQQPQRPSRTEIEKARKEGKVPPDPSDERNLQEAVEAATALFRKYYRDDCGQAGDWTSRAYMPAYRLPGDKIQYQAKYWFRQYRGLEPIRPSRITLPEPATKANDPEIELVAVFFIKADVYRSLVYPIREAYKDFREVQELDYNAGRWTPWEQNGSPMEFTLLRKGGKWQLAGTIDFQYDATYGDGPVDYTRQTFSAGRQTYVQWTLPNCDEVQRGKPLVVQVQEDNEKKMEQQADEEQAAELKAYVEEADRLFDSQAKKLLSEVFPTCRSVTSTCSYKVTYTWQAGEPEFGDNRSPWGPWGSGPPQSKPKPMEMYYRKPITITLQGLKGTCQGEPRPDTNFKVYFKYVFGSRPREWRVSGSWRNAYYEAPENLSLFDRAASSRAEHAPALCR